MIPSEVIAWVNHWSPMRFVPPFPDGSGGRAVFVEQCVPNLSYKKNTWGLLLEILIQ